MTVGMLRVRTFQRTDDTMQLQHVKWVTAFAKSTYHTVRKSKPKYTLNTVPCRRSRIETHLSSEYVY